MSFFKGVLFLGLAASGGFAEIAKRQVSQKMTTSVIIPCSAQHFEFIHNLLDCYEQQTTLPDEVIICVSQIERLNQTEIDVEESCHRIFPVKWYRYHRRRSAGINRNFACTIAKGDLLIFQDADDLPHPQRVEIIKYFFENYEINHLMHGWLQESEMFEPYDKEAIPFYSVEMYDELERVEFFRNMRIHNGNLALLRELTGQVVWDDALICDHDVKFNREWYGEYKSNVVIPCNLITYRWRFSAFNNHW
ncbi:MAG: glycosyltransferase family 2 protein [Verrucomicrobiota bacterium]|nr:glycosyltransferase family 2 protein [Verrucomicrobiota bacterium]